MVSLRLDGAQQAQRVARFTDLSDQMVAALVQRISLYEYGLRGTRGAILTAGNSIHAEQFRQYTLSRDPEREFPGARGFGYIRRVAAQDAEPFQQQVRALGHAGFTVHQMAPHDGELLVIQHIEPVAPNRTALGLDIASEPLRRDAALQAMRTGQATLSRPISLLQSNQPASAGLLFLLPVYATGETPGTDAARWNTAQGLAFAPLLLSEVMEGLHRFHGDLSLVLLDADAPGGPKRFFGSLDGAAPDTNSAAEGLERSIPLTLHGRHWIAEVRARPDFVTKLGLPDPGNTTRLIVGISVLLALALYSHLRNLQQRRSAAQANAHMAAIADNADDGLIGLDPEGHITSWNQAAERIFRRRAKEAMGKRLVALLEHAMPQSTPGSDGSTGTLADARSGLPRRARCQHDDRVLDLDIKSTPVRNPQGRVVGTAVTVRDITEQQDADERFRLAVEAAPTAMLMVGPDQRIVLVSQKAEELFGFQREDLLGMPLHALMPGRFRQGHAQDVARYMQTPRSRAMGEGRELFALHRDGHEVPVEIGLNPVHTRQGLCTLASITDISLRRNLESQLQVTLQRLQLAVHIAGLGVWVWHSHDGHLIWDDRMFSIYDVPEGQRSNGNYAELWRARLHGEDAARVQAQLQRLLQGEETAAQEEFRVVHRSGEVRHVQSAAMVERNAAGHVMRVVGVNRDVTEEKRVQARILELNTSLEDQVVRRTQELHRALAEAEKANRAKSEFLSNMSHEIRTPMNAILGLCHLLADQPLPGSAAQMVERIRNAGQTLLGILNDILDLAKIEARRLELENEPFSLTSALDTLATIMAASLGGKAVELIVWPAPAGADHLVGDKLRLNQVLINLASNAIKFTEHGEVMVRIEREDDGSVPNRVRLHFSVRDTGIGISAEQQDHIFKAFSQADSSTTRRFGGTGLGLTISSQLVTLMGGTLAVNSTLGKGSTFHFSLEFALQEPLPDTLQAMEHLHVLVADDNPTTLKVLADTVRSLGWHAEVAQSGEAALHRLQESDAPTFDVLLLDWEMPEPSGQAIARHVRAKRVNGDGNGSSNANRNGPVIVMVTSHGRDPGLPQASPGLVDAVVGKPVTASSLYNAVAGARKHRDELKLAPAARATGPHRLRGLSVLVVDDSDINREVAAAILSAEGATVALETDGAAALAHLERRAGAIDVVLMDIQMPHMDGHEATRRIRATPALRGLPVVALTAGAFSSQRDQAMAAGVDAFIAKPYKVDLLVQTLLQLCPVVAPDAAMSTTAEQAETFDTLSQPASGAATASVAEHTEGPPVDFAQGLRIWADPASLARALHKFAHTHGEDAARMRGEAPGTAASTAHRLKGVAAQMGMPAVAQCAAAVEACLKSGTGMSDALDRLQQALDNANAAIGAYAQAAPLPLPEPTGTAHSATAGEAISALQHALASDDAERIDAALHAAATALPAPLHQSLREAVEMYDFRSAEDLLRRNLP